MMNSFWWGKARSQGGGIKWKSWINCACGRVVAGWVFERCISLMSPSLQNRAGGLLLVPILRFHGSTKLMVQSRGIGRRLGQS